MSETPPPDGRVAKWVLLLTIALVLLARLVAGQEPAGQEPTAQQPAGQQPAQAQPAEAQPAEEKLKEIVETAGYDIHPGFLRRDIDLVFRRPTQ